jgi:hypothetical protein
MSHIEEAKTNLVFADLAALIREGDAEAIASHPCLALLREALTLVANRFGGEIKPFYYTYSYRERTANTGLALHLPETTEQRLPQALPRGMGLVIDEQTGILGFRGDFWDVDQSFYQHLQRQIVQTYTVLAHLAALQQMNYQVSTEVLEDRVMITGVAYA